MPVKTGTRGSSSYFITEMTINTHDELKSRLRKSKLSFERFEQGLLVRCSYATQVIMLLLPYQELQKLVYTNGDINIRHRSPFRFLVRLGVPLNVMKVIAPTMVSVSNATIQLEAKGASFVLQGPGSISSQQAFFNLVEQDRIHYQRKATMPER